ncbi:hypothetical protein [Sphingomonas glacialis]|uniref:Uncharacterized protein n=1 Tax=Sphingomonas glacialis TaxID=658225 RepID=A0A502G2M6_9SPHN|nr:hypothetical protein [Sphingomonas glacialis]TPG56079.1 hypothetical protein EAH76_00410 [Sphingomonas glacialis]
MSRAERERWAMAEEQWPTLQAFMTERLHVFGHLKALHAEIAEALQQLSFDERATMASECRDFLQTFKTRYDDREFLRDGFGVRGELPIDDRGRSQAGLTRAKVVYDSLLASLRREKAEWQPT